MSLQDLLIDLGGTSCRLALADDLENITEFQTPSQPQDLVSKIINNYTEQNIKTIKVAAAGHWNQDHILEQSHNLANYISYPLWQELSSKLKTKFELYNDMHLAAYGEAIIGQKNKFDNLLYLNLGTGIGASFYDGTKILSQSYSPCLRLDLKASPRGIFYSKSRDKSIEASILSLKDDLIELALILSPQIISIGGGKATNHWQEIIEPAIEQAQNYLKEQLCYSLIISKAKLKYPALYGLKIHRIAYGEASSLN